MRDIKMKKSFVFLLILFISVSFSQSSSGPCSNISDLEAALQCLCISLYDYISIIAFMMINLASLIYALGQFFGAETRARANVWATSMLTGAIIGIVLIIIVHAFVAILLGKGNFDPNTCKFN